MDPEISLAELGHRRHLQASRPLHPTGRHCRVRNLHHDLTDLVSLWFKSRLPGILTKQLVA